jgi:Tfp pilus assembly protein PilF
VAARAEGTGSRRWEDAAREATTARLLAPRSPAPPLVQGEIALAQGNLARARDAFEEVLRLDPKNRDALSGLARVARARKDNVEAERRLREATEAWPQDWSAWQNLGVFLSEIGEDDAAQAPLERALALSRGEHPEPALALTALFLARGEPTTALVHAERAVLQGGGAYAWYLRGRCWFDLDKLDQAEEDFRRAVLADPNLVEARGGIGQIRAMAGDLDQAAEAFRSVLAIDPNNGAARENLRRIDLARPAAPPPATAPGSSSDPG